MVHGKRRWARYCLLLTLCCYIVVLTCYDAYVFESALLIETWVKTQMRIKSDHSAKVMFSLDKSLLNPRNESRKPLILLWKPPFGDVWSNPDACSGCLLTYDHRAASEADAIIFHCAETRNSVHWFPWQHRNALQRWVWLCMEPPWNVRHVFQKTLTGLRKVFNWTMTYRADSDVLSSYSHKPYVKSTFAELKKRKSSSQMAAWVVSNCHSPLRERFVEEMRQYISVDVYGKCSGKTLCRGQCQYDTLSRYKFYFSLENSQCRDYISEKFWSMGLESGAVPVVMGPPRSDYELVAPPNSFIHIDDFPTIKKLAEYLITVSENDTLYETYFQWTKDPNWREKLPQNAKDRNVVGLVESRQYGHVNGLCALCQKLIHVPKTQVDVAHDIDQWWFGKGYSPNGDSLPICKSGSTPSGYPLRWAVTLSYSGIFVLVTLVTLCCSRSRCAKK